MARGNREPITAFNQPKKEEETKAAAPEKELPIEETPEAEAKKEATIRDLTKDIMSDYEAIVKRERVEDTHTRATFLIHNDLLKRLDKVSRGKRGYKKILVNRALERILDEIEKK